MSWYCYLLTNTYEPHKNRTYCGYTNNLKRRIRQHNGEIKGGAKYTTAFGNKQWEYLAIMEFSSKTEACQCEWKIKHIKKYGPASKVDILNKVLEDLDNMSVWIKEDN
jgi:structure-specific endonuclease subunit SLX1